MPPSYEIATGNVIASYRGLLTPLNPTEYLESKDCEIGRLKKELQGLRKIISNRHKLLESYSNQIRNNKMCISVLILLIVIVNITIVIFFVTVVKRHCHQH